METYAYDELQRLVQTTRTLSTGTETDFVRYDDLGNIVAKSDYSVMPSAGVTSPYTYGDAARSQGRAGPHAVRTVARAAGGTAVFDYDDNVPVPAISITRSGGCRSPVPLEDDRPGA